MDYSNAVYLDENFCLRKGGFSVENGRLTRFADNLQGRDMKGMYVFPGLIDIHFHGCMGYDFSTCDIDGLRAIAKYKAAHGVTSFSIASLSMPERSLKRAYRVAAAFVREEPPDCAVLRGITMEGPFLSLEKKGAQDAAYIQVPDASMFERLYADSNGLIKIVCVAPEMEGADAFIRSVAPGVRVSAAHTDANYMQAARGFKSGISHVTHLFNAMTAFSHKDPGIIGAAAEREKVTAELICDGQHVHESAVRLAFSIFTSKRICLISDAVSACGMENGTYVLGGQTIRLQDGRATLPDGTLAGSVAPLLGCVQQAVRFGIPLADAVRCASYNPACVIGVEKQTGSLAAGKDADFIVCDLDLQLSEVYIRGAKVR